MSFSLFGEEALAFERDSKARATARHPESPRLDDVSGPREHVFFVSEYINLSVEGIRKVDWETR